MATAATIGLAILLASGMALAKHGDAKPAVVWPVADIKWEESAAVPGARMAILWGDPKTGAYGALRRLPGGATLALHSHTAENKVIVVSGTVKLTMNGVATDMAPGWFAFIPAGEPHAVICKAGAECIYFEEQPAAADIKFVAPN